VFSSIFKNRIYKKISLVCDQKKNEKKKNTHTADTPTPNKLIYSLKILFSSRCATQNKKKLSTEEEELKELLSRGKKYGIKLNFIHLD
jgi:hypothetical protein